ncbi:hypothetical protein [Azohydromonas caseinilytica]|uniref:Tellurite resistance protein TerB n=1 Tax=Azohydromonas caseinilytica TaxID=2728836 RepID=A0A848F5H0_9BURK|nr:hypothetical protein [Azohydromonas caseinilytica]NML13896.1 hypothetical protein [Azohydromonas caseinilytica]
MSTDRDTDTPEAMARLIALLIVADTKLDPRELAMLDELDAFGRIGIERTEFMRVASELCEELGERLQQRPWLTLSERALIEAELQTVRDPARRRLVARLGAAVITADGRVQDSERVLFDHLLLRWGLTRADVSQAVREDGAGRAS